MQNTNTHEQLAYWLRKTQVGSPETHIDTKFTWNDLKISIPELESCRKVGLQEEKESKIPQRLTWESVMHGSQWLGVLENIVVVTLQSCSCQGIRVQYINPFSTCSHCLRTEMKGWRVLLLRDLHFWCSQAKQVPVHRGQGTSTDSSVGG